LRDRLVRGHHDVAVVDDDDHVLAQEKVDNDAAGLARVLELLVCRTRCMPICRD
jgi:hypothetical protein